MLLWALVFWHWGVVPALGMLFQAPIYAWFIYVALRQVPVLGGLMILWILCAVLVTWPKFPNVIVPGFLAGMHRAIRRDNSSKGRGA
jgi:hypothetical protein